MIYQPSLFTHINSIDTMHLNRKFCETAQFWAWYMDIIQMVLTLIRATRKATLNCMSSLSVCLVPNVHCKQSHYLRTICTCAIDYTHKFDTHHRCKELLEQNGFSVSQPLVLCLRNAFDITIRQTIKRYYRLQQLELCFVLQMEWCITHHISAQYIETTLQCTEMKYSIYSDAK